MPKKHKLEIVGAWAKENGFHKWMHLDKDEMNRKRSITQKQYNRKKNNNYEK